MKQQSLQELFRNKLFLLVCGLAVIILGVGAVLIYDKTTAVNLEDCTVTLSETDCSYTGKPVVPQVTITYGKKTLKEDQDFVCETENDTNPGKASLTLAGKGHYSGIIHKSYRISVDPAKDLKAEYIKPKKENGQSVAPSPYVELTWEPSSCCLYYVVTVTKKGTDASGAPSEPISHSIKTTTYRFFTSERFGTYDFAVRAVAGSQRTSSNPATTNLTLNTLTKPSIKVRGDGCRRIAVTWNRIDDADKYVIKETRDSTGKTTTYKLSNDEAASGDDEDSIKAYFDEKEIGASYTYTVQAVTKVDGVKYKSKASKSKSATAPAPRIGQATIGETGHGSGNRLGDQTGRELGISRWSYSGKSTAHNHWTRVLRFKDPAKAEIAASTMEACCENNNVGYDNGTKSKRLSLYYEAKAHDYDCAAITSSCATACSQLVSVCVNSTGIHSKPDVNAQMMYDNMSTFSDDFEILTDSKYTASPNLLKRGDILVCLHSNGRNNHTCMVL